MQRLVKRPHARVKNLAQNWLHLSRGANTATACASCWLQDWKDALLPQASRAGNPLLPKVFRTAFCGDLLPCGHSLFPWQVPILWLAHSTYDHPSGKVWVLLTAKQNRCARCSYSTSLEYPRGLWKDLLWMSQAGGPCSICPPTDRSFTTMYARLSAK